MFSFSNNPFSSELKTPEYLKKNPNGKVPLLETPNGKFIFESNAILRYVARLDQSKGLYGRNEIEAAEVDQWIDWFATNYEKDLGTAVMPHLGRNLHITKTEQQEALNRVLEGFKVLENHLKLNSFLVENRVTIADIAIAAGLNRALRLVWDEKVRKNIPNITRWFDYLSNQEPFKKVYGPPALCVKASDRSQFEAKVENKA